MNPPSTRFDTDPLDVRAFSLAAGIVGALLLLAGAARRYCPLDAVTRVYDLKPPLDPVATMVVGAVIVASSVTLAIWASRRKTSHRHAGGHRARWSSGAHRWRTKNPS